MSADWKAGDLAVCVDARPGKGDPKAHLLVERRIYRVGVAGVRQDGVFALAFRCLISSPGKGWAFTATRFRKIDAADEQFTQTVRECRPAPETVMDTALALVEAADRLEASKALIDAEWKEWEAKRRAAQEAYWAKRDADAKPPLHAMGRAAA